MSASIYGFEYTTKCPILTTEQCREIAGTGTVIANYFFIDKECITQAIHFDSPLKADDVKKAIETAVGSLQNFVRMSTREPLEIEKVRTAPSTGEKQLSDEIIRTAIRYKLFMNRNSAQFGSFVAPSVQTDLFGCPNSGFIPDAKEGFHGHYNGSDKTFSIDSE